MIKDLVESLSGIRGIYDSGITEELARKYILAYFQLFSGKISTFLIAGDSRPSTEKLKKAIVSAVGECGDVEITDVGVVPIQVAEHAIQYFNLDGGVYITASHNEPEYNGFKFLKKDGSILYPKQSEKLIELAHLAIDKRDGFNRPINAINKQEEAIEAYLSYVLESIGRESLEKIKNANFKILADPNGGSAVNILDKLFEKLGIDADIINNKLGEFNRKVEPNAESLTPLADKIVDTDYEFACGFDCDADRIEFVIQPNQKFFNEVVLDGNYVMALACDTKLKNTNKEIVVTNTVTSPLIRDVVRKHNAVVKEAEIGEMAVVEEMEKQNSIIGGEGSNGGVIIPPIKCRDGVMTLVLILKMLAETGKSLIDIVLSYPSYYSDRVKVACTAEESIEIQDKLAKHFIEQGCKVQRTGDLKVWVDNNSYIWFHQSGTEAGVFRIIVDGDNKEKVAKMLQQGITAFNKFK